MYDFINSKENGMKRLLFIGNYSSVEEQLIEKLFLEKEYEVHRLTDTALQRETVEKYCHENNIDWVIGVSDIGEDMMLLRGIKKILINPILSSTHEIGEQPSAFDVSHTFGLFDKRHESDYEEYHRYGYREACFVFNEICEFCNWTELIISMIEEAI